MKRVIIAARTRKKDYTTELNDLPLGQVIQVGRYKDLFIKLHTTYDGSIKSMNDYFFALNRRYEFVDSTNMASGRVEIYSILGMNKLIQTCPENYKLVEILDENEMLDQLNDTIK